MKLKFVALIGVLMFSMSVFAQKTETPKPADVKPAEPKTADAKPADAKPADAKPVTPAKLPTAKEIIDKYVAAIGGREANEKLKSSTSKGTIELSPMGIKGSTEATAVAPNKMYTKTNLSGIGEIIEGFDGTTAWSINPLQGNRNKEGEELLQTKLAYNFYRSINLDKLYPKMEVKGMDKVGDKDVYVIVGTPEGLPSETFYFDTKTGLLLRSDSTLISPEGRMATKIFFDDYREVDGVKMPFKIRNVLPQFEIIITMTEVKNNVTVADALFTRPKE